MIQKQLAIILAAAMCAKRTPAAACSTESMNAVHPETAAVTETGSSVQKTGTAPVSSEVSSEETDGESLPKDNISVTHHTAVVQGKKLSYTAEAGTMALNTGGNNCELFFTAYTLDNVKDRSERPVTFAFNGGPGSCSMFVHVGCLGPRRIEMDEKGNAVSLPAKITDNENSLLDLTDLVIIDAVGTGYSRSLEENFDAFMGYENDARTMGDFIRQYINRNNRWGSRKYIAGESYGTIRSVAICKYLATSYAMYLNGLILISSANDLSATFLRQGTELPYATFIPTYAADAWYHGMLDPKYQVMELEAYLDEVRTFVSEEYVSALFVGNRMTEQKKAELA